MIKKLIFFVLLCSLLPLKTEACTAVYIGKKVSASDSTLIARSEDLSSFTAYNKMFTVVPRIENKPNRVFRDRNGFSVALPPTTYKYTTLSNGGSSAPHTFPSVCTNEKGVTITATVDAYIKREAVKADPYVASGISENSIAEAIAMTASSAKDGVEKLGKLAKTQGLTEAYIILLADQKETWMMEFYTGHQWAAYKLPEDKACVMGNQFMFDTLNHATKDNFLHSPSLFSLAEKHGFAEKENGKIHLGKTYGKKFFTYNNGRTWIGQKLLAPNTTDEKYNANKLYPFLFTPDKKVTVKDVMELYRNKYEGTNLDQRKPENKNIRIIGTPRQQEVHIVEINSDFPPECSAVQWLCLANAEHSMFVPSFSCIDNTIYPYKVNTRSYNPHSAYWEFQKTAAKGNQNAYNSIGKNIRSSYNKLELDFVAEVEKAKKNAHKLYKKDPIEAQKYLELHSAVWARGALLLADSLK